DRRRHGRAYARRLRRGPRAPRRDRGPRGERGARVSEARSGDGQAAHKVRLLRRVRRAVVKIGSNVLAGPEGLRRARVRALAAEIAALVADGRQIVVVSSGAVAAGTSRLGTHARG